MNLSDLNIAVIGLGYVGLPLAVEFGKKYSTVGFDIKVDRIVELESGKDSTLEVSEDELKSSEQISFTANVNDLRESNFYIVTVPTPIDANKRPNLTPLEKASEVIGAMLSKGDVVVYESTVYPGVTEEVCLPILEKQSGLKFNKDFYLGYSPERINPGDKKHRLVDILKVTSGSTTEVAQFIDSVYASIIKAGTYMAESIKVAEAAKVIENTQRDLNIALINELSLIFERVGIDTEHVLKAAGTKWNFLNFKPGLVGGHCIGVDPYYLTHKAQELGYSPEVILAGRRINDNMGNHVASNLVKQMSKRGLNPGKSKILIMGLTFKENCPDLRNTKVTDIVTELKDYGATLDIYDPWVDAAEAKTEYGLDVYSKIPGENYDGILVCVAHSSFKEMTVADLRKKCKSEAVIYDLKYVYPETEVDARL